MSLVGLISALAGDGMWDALSWVAPGLPLMVVAWAELRIGR